MWCGSAVGSVGSVRSAGVHFSRGLLMADTILLPILIQMIYNLQYTVPPWFHFESYDVKFINNVLHDIDGAGEEEATIQVLADNARLRELPEAGSLSLIVHMKLHCLP
jgi:hypothetical protein